MGHRPMVTMDGNDAAGSVAHRTNEVIAIYPITPSSPMGELADALSVEGRRNIWGTVPQVMEMEHEGGAAAAMHGALQSGSLSTTFTASQGLLLMIPTLYKIAGELSACCIHVAARTLATHCLSIFGDHSDVMAVRQTGFALLGSGSVQEAHDFACIGQAATLRSRVPFIHFFDGFRTSHELAKIEVLADDDLRFMIDEELVEAHRSRALTPDRPVIRGTAQNPDAFFQAREACNGFYIACPEIVQATMDRFAELTGRQYRLFDYVGHPQPDRVIVIMGSGAEVAHETMEWFLKHDEKVGVLKVRLYRPFSMRAFARALPASVRAVAVLERTKEPGALGEPMYLDVLAALHEARTEGVSPFAKDPLVIGGRYGLSSKEFSPAMVKAVFDELAKDAPKNHFTVGIVDDVTHTSLPVDASFDIEPDDVVRAVFFGLGADGTVGANKNSIKIIGEETDNYAQGYFVYDSKKAGAVTISHLRFGPRPLRSSYLVNRANFVACHQIQFIDKLDILEAAAPGAVVLLNVPYDPDEVWDNLPREVQETIVEKGLRLYAIDAYKVAKDTGMGVRINTIMQTCFFAISGVLPRDEAVAKIKDAIKKTYSKRGSAVVQHNYAAVDQTLAHLHEIAVPERATAVRTRPPIVSEECPDFVRKVSAVMLANKGDLLPVSAFPVDGTWPVGTAKWEKRNIGREIPIWVPDLCTQCNQCAFVCPHAAIRAKVYDPALLQGAPASFESIPYKTGTLRGLSYTIQVAPEDCTGCNLCVEMCPARDKSAPGRKAINMEPQAPVRDRERENYRFFLQLPNIDRTRVKRIDSKGSQFFEPLFEFSGACAGCGETPYIKLLTQLFGDRALIGNATGCSSIYGGNLPTTPYTVNSEGRGPAWCNSLFEDNAEFSLGFRLSIDMHVQRARTLLERLAPKVGERLVTELLHSDQYSEAGIQAQRERVAALRKVLAGIDTADARQLTSLADYLVRKTVWAIGGDGWAYDIGYGGLDHVVAQNRDVNILVLDTEVYSNTGGQQSKATPLGASAKFAVAGKELPKKDLGMQVMTYGNVYVARVALWARINHVTRVFLEADSYHGTSLIIAHAPCIAHGYDLRRGIEQQKLTVNSGVWPLYRFDPRRIDEGRPPLELDSRDPTVGVRDYLQNESRFRMVEAVDRDRFERLVAAHQRETTRRFAVYKQLAGISFPRDAREDEEEEELASSSLVEAQAS